MTTLGVLNLYVCMYVWILLRVQLVTRSMTIAVGTIAIAAMTWPEQRSPLLHGT